MYTIQKFINIRLLITYIGYRNLAFKEQRGILKYFINCNCRSKALRDCYSCDNCRIVKYADDVFRPDCILGLYKVMISIHELDNLVREGSIRCKHYINRLLGG